MLRSIHHNHFIVSSLLAVMELKNNGHTRYEIILDLCDAFQATCNEEQNLFTFSFWDSSLENKVIGSIDRNVKHRFSFDFSENYESLPENHKEIFQTLMKPYLHKDKLSQ